MESASAPWFGQRQNRIPLPQEWFLAAHWELCGAAVRFRRQPYAHSRRQQHRMASGRHKAGARGIGLILVLPQVR